MDIRDLIKQVDVNSQIELDEIPELDLYMDQVIQLFEQSMESIKRYENDKVMTKTMINNYAKGKLLMPINNKKYSKEHLILISLIYNYKGTLSINDIKMILNKIVKEYDKDNKDELRNIYELYLDECKSNSDMFNKEVNSILDNIELKSDNDYEKKLLLVSSLVNMSNMYRRLSEKIVDKYFMEE